MADQGRWFKLWCSALLDDHLQALPPADRWAWAALGCYIKQHGTHGVVSLNGHNMALAGAMGVTPERLIACISALPHVRVEEDKNRDGAHVVTMENWKKYQEDATGAERMRALRSKRRREEKRSSPPASLPSEDSFFEKLRNNPGYKGIDIERELAKMDAWFLTPAARGRKKTRRFIVNWLNRIDCPEPASGPVLTDRERQTLEAGRRFVERGQPARP